jgi:uncharacterized lipoprotein YajG
MKLVIGLAGVALLGGCATGNGSPAQSDRAVLAQKCQARGGHLVAIAGANNANEAANFYCDLPGGDKSH